MQGKPQANKFKEARPFADPKAAVEELMRIFREFLAAKSDPTSQHTYAGVTNQEFIVIKGASVEEWSHGIACKEQGWITMDDGGRVFPSDSAA